MLVTLGGKLTTGMVDSVLAVFNTDVTEECKAPQLHSAREI